MDLSIIKSFIVIIPLSLIGISFIKRIITEKRAEVVIPLGIIAGISTYIFFLNLLSYIFKGYWGIIFSFFSFILLSAILISKFRRQILSYPKGMALKLWKISIVVWGLFLYYPIAHRYLIAESFMYFSIAKTFIHGNFPILSPWQPDLYVAYHYGPSIFMGAINALTGVHLDQIQRLVALILILCSFELLTFGLKRIYNFRTFLFFQIIVFFGLISYGSIMLAWPVWPIQLPDPSFLRNIAAWMRQFPTMYQTMDSYGMPGRLLLVSNQVHHAFGLADFFLILFISLYSKTKNKLFWIVLFASLAALALIDEPVFVSAVALSFFILFFKENKSWKIFNKKNLKLVLFFIAVGLVALVQGGMITDDIFRNKSLEQGMTFMTLQQIPEKLHYLFQRVFQVLPINSDWYPFQWAHLDFIPVYIIIIVLLLILRRRIKKTYSMVIGALVSAAFIPNVLYYVITVKFMPSDGNRFLTFTYMFLGIALALEIVLVLEKLYSLKNKIYAVLLSLVVVWITIPSSIPLALDFWSHFNRQNYFFQPEYTSVPSLDKWLEKNVSIPQRVLDLANQTTYITEDTRYYGAWMQGVAKPPSVFSGVFTPYWDGKYIAYMYSVGPDYLDVLYTINPTSLKKLKLNFLIIDKQFFQTLPKIRQQQLEDSKYFTKVYTGNEGVNNYWISIYRVESAYLNEIGDLKETVDTLDKMIPKKAVVYLDKEYDPYSWLNIRNSMFITFKNRDLVFFPQGYGGYGFIGTLFPFRFPKEGDTYDYLILKSTTDPKSVCNCKVKPIWYGYRNRVVAWKVVR